MSVEQKTINWSNINVLRNRKYESLVNMLCVNTSHEYGKPVFDFIKDLMVFAAMLGYKYQKMEEVEPNSIQITLGTYATDEKDGYIYLLSLITNRNVECLRDENLHSTVKIFEKYCNGGLSIIQDWITEHPEDQAGVDTLIEKMQDEIVSWEDDQEVNYDEVSF